MNNKYAQDAISALIFIIVLLLGLFVYGKFGPGLPLSVNQITTNKNDLFTVTGEGRVTVKPDVAEVNFGVNTTGATVALVQSQSNTAINRVVEAVKKLGIEAADIKTTNYNIYPQYANEGIPTPMLLPTAEPTVAAEEKMAIAPMPPKPGTPRITSYSMNISVIVKVRDLNKVNQVVDTATANGANQVGGINFTVDKPEIYQAEARKKAVENAKAKANDLASVAGIQLGKVVGIYENPGFYGRNYPLAMKAEGMGGDMGGTQIEPGSSEITTQVTLNYETR